MEGLSTVLLLLALAAGLSALLLPALPQIKGRIGEWLVHFRLSRSLPASHYTIIRDIKLRRSGASNVVRVGHVVVSAYGLFVIETCHWSGWLFGAERDAEWTRMHFRARRREPNPLRQLQTRVAALQEALGLDAALFHPLVVLTGGAQFRTALPPNITPLGGMIPFIQVRSRETLGYEAVPQVAQRLEALRVTPGPQTRAAQIAELRRSQRTRFGARQATTALAFMLAMVSVAGLLIQNLAEVPGRYPAAQPVAASPFSDDAPPPRIELPHSAGMAPEKASPRRSNGELPDLQDTRSMAGRDPAQTEVLPAESGRN